MDLCCVFNKEGDKKSLEDTTCYVCQQLRRVRAISSYHHSFYLDNLIVRTHLKPFVYTPVQLAGKGINA